MVQQIYINWNLGSYTYTMTVNVSGRYRLLALNSLKEWLKINKRQVRSWAFDDGSNSSTDHFNTVRDLINITLNK